MCRQVHKSIVVSLILLTIAFSASAVSPDELWDQVLDNHKELRASDVKIRQSQFDLQQAKASRFPEIGAEITGTYIANPMERIVVYPEDLGPGYELPSGSGAPIELYGGQESSMYQFNLTVTQPVFTWGKINNSIELNRELERSAVIEKQMILDELRTSFEIILDNLMFLEQMKEIMGLQHEVVERLYTLAEQNYRYGTVLEDELLAAGMRLRRVQLGADQLEVQYDQLELQLQQLVGDYSLSAQDVEHEPDTEKMLGADVSQYREMESEIISSDQHAIALQEHGAEVRKLAAEIASGSLYWKPDIAIRLDLGYSGPRFPFVEIDWFGQNDYSLNATIAVTTTLWDGGKALIDKASAVFEAGQSAAERREVEQELLFSYRKLVLEFGSAVNAASYYRDKIASDEKLLENRRRQRESGSGTEADLLAAESQLYDDRLSYYQELSNLSRAYHALQSLID
jgi:outer membrane protein TolC